MYVKNEKSPCRYVIIGNSAAAVGAVEAIRKTDTKGAITIITDEPHHTYSRPLISYLLYGKTTEEKMKYRGNNFYTDNNCEVLFRKTAVKIDKDKKTVILDDGAALSYDKLLVAAGSSPFVPPMAGLDAVENKFTFISLDDAKALDAALNENSKALIIGAGLIGLKCAEGISKKVKGSTVVDLSDKVLSSILDADASELVKKHLENNNITFQLGTSVKEFKENKAYLENGEVIDFDVLVLAVGVRANVGLVKEIGGAAVRGITVNGKQETTIPDIYAAGDCTETRDAATGDIKVMALLPNAYMQGESAGYNMAGAEYSFDKAIPVNAIGFFGLHIVTAGTYTGETYVEIDEERRSLKKLFYSDNKLNGFIIIENVEKAGVYTALIRERTPLDTIDFNLICQKPGLMAFTKNIRSEILGKAQ